VIMLDTHALVWWVAEPKRIPAPARRLLDAAVKARDTIAISSISIWEIAMLVDRGRLKLTIGVDQWIAHVEALPFLRFVPVDNRIALKAVHLGDFPHRDPADRIIVATATGLSATLVSADARIRALDSIDTIWD
jgi:PIN domain nuclease of toxin-antitoxin system